MKSRPMTTRAVVLLVALLASSCQQAAEPPKNMTEEQKAIYAFGLAIGRQVAQQTKQIHLTPAEIEIFKSGFGDALADKKPALDPEKYAEAFQQLAQARLNAGAAENRKQGEAFLAKAAQEPGVIKTESGLVYKTLTPGTGAKPQATDTVSVNYQGTLPDGKVFDSSYQRGQPAEFALNQVIPCWTEGVQRMQVGEKARLVCPADLAYRDRAAGDIPPGSTLVFEVELLGIKGK